MSTESAKSDESNLESVMHLAEVTCSIEHTLSDAYIEFHKGALNSEGRMSPYKAVILLSDVLEDNPGYYLECMSKILEMYESSLGKELGALHDRVSHSTATESIAERPMSFLPDWTYSVCMGIARILSAPGYWLQGTTLKSRQKQELRNAKQEFEKFNTLKQDFEYGIESISNFISEHNEYSEKFQQYLSSSQELLHLCNRLIGQSQNYYDSQRRLIQVTEI